MQSSTHISGIHIYTFRLKLLKTHNMMDKNYNNLIPITACFSSHINCRHFIVPQEIPTISSTVECHHIIYKIPRNRTCTYFLTGFFCSVDVFGDFTSSFTFLSSPLVSFSLLVSSFSLSFFSVLFSFLSSFAGFLSDKN